MKNKRKPYKSYKIRQSKVFETIKDHIKKNINEYVISTVVLVAGVIIGVVMVNNASEESRAEITGYINKFVDSIKCGEYTIDGNKLLMKSIFSNLKFALFVWIAGSTIIGIPIIYSLLGYKGLCMGYSISAIMGALGKSKGLILATSTMLIQDLIAIPCILALTVSSVKMYKVVIKKNKDDIKPEIYRHTAFSAIMTTGLMTSSFMEFLFTTFFFSDIIIKFV